MVIRAILCLSLMVVAGDSIARPGQSVADYRIGQVVAAYQLRPGLDAKRYEGAITAKNAGMQTIKVLGINFPVSQVWVPTAGPKSVPSPAIAVGASVWGVQLEQPLRQGVYSFGGYRTTNIGRIVLCLWLDGRTQALTDAQCTAATTAQVMKAHVEQTDAMR